MKHTKSIVLLSIAATVIASPTAYGPDEDTFTPLIEFNCGSSVDRWIGEVGIGTPKRDFRLIIDTSTVETWVAGVKCQSDFCINQHTELYNAGESSTSCNLNQTIQLKYDDGTVTGELYKDVVTLGSIAFPDTPIGKAFGVEGFKDIDDNFVGFLGLGIDGINAKRDSHLSKRGRYNGGMSFSSRGGKRKRSNTDTCILGTGIDRKSIIGDVFWFNLPSCSHEGPQSWKTDLSCVDIKGVVSLKLEDAVASFDTGAKKIQIPKKHLDTIYNSLGATCPDNSNNYEFKCCYANDLKFSLDKYDVTLPSSVWAIPKDGTGEYCTAIFEESPDDTDTWSLGQDFMLNFFSIYDADRSQTGLAISLSSPTGVQISSK